MVVTALLVCDKLSWRLDTVRSDLLVPISLQQSAHNFAMLHYPD